MGSWFPSPGDLPNLGIKPMSPALQAGSVPSEQPGKPNKKTGVGCHALLQGIFPTQGSNPGVSHYKWILIYRLSHQGSPRILRWVAYPFSRGSYSGIQPGSPALQTDSLPAELPGKPELLPLSTNFKSCIRISIKA